MTVSYSVSGDDPSCLNPNLEKSLSTVQSNAKASFCKNFAPSEIAGVGRARFNAAPIAVLINSRSDQRPHETSL
jgi:hypothetical protein